MNQKEINSAAEAIRKRLFLLLFQSFSVVFIVVLILILGSMFFLYYRVSNFYPPFRPMLSNVLEAYYQGHGNWEGVQTLLPQGPRAPMNMEQNEWFDSLLLDADGRVILDHGLPVSPRLGELYRPMPDESLVPLRVNSRIVGTLIVTRQPSGFDVLSSLLIPFGTTTVFLGILTVLIGLLLSRRLINPLAEVIAASHAMTTGNLGARVKVQGPDDLQMLSDSFNQMAVSLEKNDRDQRNLIADIAHELRTPLSIIQGKLEGIVDGIYPSDQAHIQPILNETRQLEHLITDLDVLAQADSNQLKFALMNVNLADLAGNSIKLFEAEASEKKITVKLRTTRNTPPVTGDPQRISQVINNLLGNAIRYIPEKGKVEVDVHPVEDGVELTVSDNGPGIPESELPEIFNRFWRGDKSRARVSGGAGLGLAIARQFVEIQSGRIYAVNRPGGGLTVGFVLPAASINHP
jgi:two-component system OmpR family sensor kinase/two-component system sensor histidine kinase BaeS